MNWSPRALDPGEEYSRRFHLTLTLVKRHQYPYPLRLEFRLNALIPEANKLKISKVSRKKDMQLNGEIFKFRCTCMQVWLQLFHTQLCLHVQQEAVLRVSLLLITIILPNRLQNYLNLRYSSYLISLLTVAPCGDNPKSILVKNHPQGTVSCSRWFNAPIIPYPSPGPKGWGFQLTGV